MRIGLVISCVIGGTIGWFWDDVARWVKRTRGIKSAPDDQTKEGGEKKTR